MPVPTAPAHHHGARGGEHRRAARPQTERGGQHQGAHEGQRRGPPVWPLGNARASSWPMVRSTTGFPNVVISPVSPGPPTANTAARGAPVTRQTTASRPAATVDDRRRTEHGHGPGEPALGRGKRVDRAVEVAVDPAGGVVARVAHGEDRDDGGREHRDRRRGPAGPVGEQRAVGEGHQPDGTETRDGPGGVSAARRCGVRPSARPSPAPVRRTPCAPWWVWSAARGCGSSAPSDRSGPRCPGRPRRSGPRP